HHQSSYNRFSFMYVYTESGIRYFTVLLAFNRSRIKVEDISINGISIFIIVYLEFRRNPDLFTPTNVTMSTRRSILCQCGKYSTMLAPIIKKNFASLASSFNVLIVSNVYDFPKRSISIVLTLKFLLL